MNEQRMRGKSVLSVNRFNPSEEVVITPEDHRKRSWQKRFGTSSLDISEMTIYPNNGHGRFFDQVCEHLSKFTEPINDQRNYGHCYFLTHSNTQMNSGGVSCRFPYKP
jgi:hypothetical protein